MLDFSNDPHSRYNPLTGESVRVSPHRTKRPWQGRVDPPQTAVGPRHDPTCYLCPGNDRIGGDKNPAYTGPFVFTNDFSAYLPDSSRDTWSDGDLFQAQGTTGICKVMCFSPRHDVTLARMEVSEIRDVVAAWKTEYETLGANPDIRHVQIFENRGEIMGCSNPHPHCQIWAESLIPDLPAKELERQTAWYRSKGRTMLLDYAEQEVERKVRVVCLNERFVAVVPFWAVWPFETLVLPRKPLQSLSGMDGADQEAFAAIISELTIRYDNLFQCSFPYSMGIHQLPTDGQDYPGLQFHAHFFPPLLRSASVRKFMVGYEMLAMAQRDLTAEQAAERLRNLPAVHYLAGAAQ